MTQKGFILLTDISGYTAYLSKTELAHAQDVLQSLLQNLAENIQPPIAISRIEGDGIFAYTTDNSFLQGQTLLDVIEQLYSSFAYQLEHIIRNTTCTCQACKRIPELGLKMIIHYGEFGLQHVAQITDLVGTSINLAHRLMKNAIIEETGVSEYAFFTDESIQALHLGDFAEKAMVRHTETYEYIGEVHGFVYDLLPVWQRNRERHRIFISSEEAFLETTYELPASPPIVWDRLLDPEIRRLYMAADKMGTKKIDGRMTVGAEFHCAHGEQMSYQLLVDMKPFEYYTSRDTFSLTGNIFATVDYTTRLDETPNGTRVINYYQKAKSDKLLGKIILKMMEGGFKKMLTGNIAHVEKVLTQAIASGSISEMPRIIIEPPNDKGN